MHNEIEPGKRLLQGPGVALVRRPLFLATQSIIMFIAAYVAYLPGLVSLVLPTFPGLWGGVYHESGN